MRLKVKLWEHQEEMTNFAIDKFKNGLGIVPLNHPDTRYAWWVAGCRTGKTLASLAIIERMGFKRSLIVTKKAAIASAWEADIEDHIEDLNVLYLDEYVSGTGVARKRLNSSQKAELVRDFVNSTTEAVVVVNYATAKLIADTLNSLNFDYVVLDESHMVKTHNSGVSVALAKQLRDIPYKLIMTGTAWSDRPTDVYGQVRFLANNGQGRYPSSTHFGTWGAFFEKHVLYYLANNVKIPKGYKNVDNIHQMVDDFTMLIKTEDVLTLPPVRHIDIELDMPAKMKTAYNDLEQLLIAEMSEDDLLVADNRLTLALRLHQLTGGYYPNEDGQIVEYLKDKDNPKLQALLEIVDEIDNQPMVVFTRFRHDVAIIERALVAKGIEVKKLTGDVQEHVEWQRQGKGQILIANMQAGSTGVTLSRARYVTFYSVGHSRTDYEQALWRVRDNNSDKDLPIVFHHLIVRNSVDVDIRAGLQAKGEMSDYLLSNLSNRLTSIS